jgi:hypothetical protein
MTDAPFYADIIGEDRVRNFDRLPEVAQRIILEKVRFFTEEVADRAGQLLEERLKTKTGRLTAASVKAEVRNVDGRVQGRVSVDSPYAAIQEKGGTTPPHVIYPKNGKVLAFMAATGDKVFATRVMHPGGHIEGKHFMKDAYREFGPQISRGLKQALVQGIRANMRGQS